MKLKRAKEGKKIPPIPGFELQVTRCLVWDYSMIVWKSKSNITVTGAIKDLKTTKL